MVKNPGKWGKSLDRSETSATGLGHLGHCGTGIELVLREQQALTKTKGAKIQDLLNPRAPFEGDQ